MKKTKKSRFSEWRRRMDGYARDVAKGKILACKWAKLACRRYLKDLKRKDIYLDEDAVAHVCEFIEQLRHFEGEWGGTRIRLMDWQVFILGNVFGWMKVKTGKRRFKYVYLEFPRKHGKTLLAAAVGIYMLACDGEPGAQVYLTATKKDQAAIAFRGMRTMIEKQPDSDFRALFHATKNPAKIEYPYRDGFAVPLSKDADGGSTDGLNPHLIICDEVHAWTDHGYWNVLNSALRARAQPLIFEITTAGHAVESVGRSHHKIVEEILETEGISDKDDFFGIIHTIDEGDDIEDPKTWAKANPMYGITVSEDTMRSELALAMSDPAIMREFKVKSLNIWLFQKSLWLESESWQVCHDDEFTMERLRGMRCYGGLDLAITTDLSALVLTFPPQPGIHEGQADLTKVTSIPFFWCPADSIGKRTRRDKVPYQSWAELKHITATPGKVMDHDYIVKKASELADFFDVRAIGYDRHYATNLILPLEEEGLNMIEYIQTITYMSPPAKKLEALVVSGEYEHTNNPVMNWCAGNVVVFTDANGNIRPDKKKSEERIDGIVADIISIGVMDALEDEQGGTYEVTMA